MRNINFKQIIVVLFFLFFLFGDLSQIKKKIADYSKKITFQIVKKNKKKRG